MISIFVEGEDDKEFLDAYIKYLDRELDEKSFKIQHTGKEDESGEEEKSGGKDKLGNEEIVTKITDALREKGKVVVIFDADCDYKKSRKDIERVLNKIKRDLRNEGAEVKDNQLGIFLISGKNSKGELEDLLEQINKCEHQSIFDCFEEYKKCVKGHGYAWPSKKGKKGKIYAYRQLLGIEKKKDGRRFDPEFWDFDNDALSPLKKFLKQQFKRPNKKPPISKV